MKHLIRVVLVTALLSLAVACSSEPDMVGKWVGKTGSFEFSSDKTGVINPPADRADLPKNVGYNWSIQGKDTVKMEIGAPVGKVIFGKLEGKNVLVVEEDKFTRQ